MTDSTGGSPQQSDRPPDLLSWCARNPAPTEVAPALEELISAGLLALPLPGCGRTHERLLALATISAHDVALGRLVEGHVDAVAILAEAGAQPPPRSRLGVWAAGPPADVVAEPAAGGVSLRGTRRWCSGASFLTHALVVASHLGARQLFLVDLSLPGIAPDPGSWRAVGMARSDTLDVTFTDVVIDGSCAVGDANWYLDRVGFWQGSIGVAACWWGGACGVGAALEETLPALEPHRDAHRGAVAARLWSLRLGVAAAAAHMDADPHDEGGRTHTIALALRHLVEQGSEEVISRVGRALGAAPLCRDPAHAHRVADLTVYLRQHHGERDLAELGKDAGRSTLFS
jgi:hypothetical protein